MVSLEPGLLVYLDRLKRQIFLEAWTSALVALPVFWLAGQGAWVTGAFDNWPLIFLMLFPEGFINGMLVTALTVFYPDVVKTFDDDYYLNQ